MKTQINIIGLLLICCAIPVKAQTKIQTDSTVFIQLEDLWNKAHLENDAEVLANLWADELTVTVPTMAPMSKNELIRFVKSGRMIFSRYETSELSCKVIGETAIVTGQLERTRKNEGNLLKDNWRFTKTYIWKDNRWQVVAFHASSNEP